MRFENLITLTAGFVLCGAVSGDLCAYSKELRKIRKNQTNHSWEHKQIERKNDSDVPEEARYCGEGYAERLCNEHEFVCEPLCPAGCENGTCIAPGLCDCADGYELRVNTRKHACIPLKMERVAGAARQRREVQEEKSKSDNLDICRDSCDCWSLDGEGHCVKFCDSGDSGDADCLKPESSDCKANGYTIVYKVDGKSPKTYKCDTESKKTYSTVQRYFIIGCCIFIGIMLIAIVYLCVRIYQTRHETGAHDIPISLLMKF